MDENKFAVGKNPHVHCILEMVSKFESLEQTLAFYNSSNPARQKFRNILEPEQGSNHYFREFEGDSPAETWCAIAYAIGLVLKGKTHDKYWVWIWRRLGEATEGGSDQRKKSSTPTWAEPLKCQASIEELCRTFKRKKSTIYNWLDDVDTELSQILIKRGILKRQDCSYGH